MNIYRQILTKYWGYPNFRPLQEEIIQSVAEGKDTLGLMPTGGGKSIVFQVYALSKEGICIVVTPLIALMKDQVDNLKKKGIKALAIYSGMTKDEINITLDNCIFGDYKFLYVSPERLGTELFLAKLQKMKVNLLAIDESHCISQWGYDFRPSYLKIADIRQQLPNIPVLALTATATKEVVEDIQNKLQFKEHNLFSMSFERKNLNYFVRTVEDKQKQLLKIIENIPGTGVVYVRDRKKTKEIVAFLRENKISSDYYHAGLDNKTRDFKQSEWKTGRCRVMVATNAFGMGIDKANVRFVVHMDLPDSLEAYFQEAGRGGRDEKKAYAILLYNNADKIKLEKSIRVSFPEIDYIKRVYEALGNYFQIPIGGAKFMSYDFDIGDFCATFKFEILSVFNAIKLLQLECYIEATDDLYNPSKVHFTINRDDLYKFQVSNAAFDGFIKLVLRNYTGLFTDFVGIDEVFLAKQANVSIDIIYKYLQTLAGQGIIKYIPQRKTPLIAYTEERLDQKSLHISKENYDIRKARYIQKVEAVLDYAMSTNKCRSQILLSYFGDKDPYRCGQCDVCLRRNELGLSKYEFDIILEKVKAILKKEPTRIDLLVDKVSFSEDKIFKVIQWLLDNNKVIYNDGDKLFWNDTNKGDAL